MNRYITVSPRRTINTLAQQATLYVLGFILLATSPLQAQNNRTNVQQSPVHSARQALVNWSYQGLEETPRSQNRESATLHDGTKVYTLHADLASDYLDQPNQRGETLAVQQILSFRRNPLSDLDSFVEGLRHSLSEQLNRMTARGSHQRLIVLIDGLNSPVQEAVDQVLTEFRQPARSKGTTLDVIAMIPISEVHSHVAQARQGNGGRIALHSLDAILLIDDAEFRHLSKHDGQTPRYSHPPHLIQFLLTAMHGNTAVTQSLFGGDREAIAPVLELQLRRTEYSENLLRVEYSPDITAAPRNPNPNLAPEPNAAALLLSSQRVLHPIVHFVGKNVVYYRSSDTTPISEYDRSSYRNIMASESPLFSERMIQSTGLIAIETMQSICQSLLAENTSRHVEAEREFEASLRAFNYHAASSFGRHFTTFQRQIKRYNSLVEQLRIMNRRIVEAQQRTRTPRRPR